MKSLRQPTCFATRIVPLIISLMGLPAAAQVTASPQQPQPESSLQESVRALAREVNQLNATILELRNDMSQSRQETRELREQLQRAMGQIATLSAGTVTSTQSALPVAPVAPGPGTSTMSSAQDREKESRAQLEKLEENQTLLKAMVEEQHQTKVESASKYRIRLTGIALLNVFGNRGKVDNLDVPNLALPRGKLDTGGSFGATVRQSEVGFEVYGPTLAGARTSADMHLDLFGGFPDTADGVTAGLVRLRTATVRMDWARTSLVVGQDAPFFSPLSPTSIASLGYPAFSYSGNLWTWTPQVRLEHRVALSAANSILFQGGILDPLSGETPYDEFYRTPQAGEKSRQPAYATRLAWSHGDPTNPLTIGIGGYYSRQDYGARRTEDAWAGTVDWSVPLGKWLGLSGEFYRGRALGGLGGGEGRSVIYSGPQTDPNSSVVGLNSIGGWTQLKFKASEALEFNAGFGEDNPFARDLRYIAAPTSYGYSSVSRNQSGMVNVIYRPRTDLIFSLEFRHLDTTGIYAGKETANHVNLGVGVLF